MKRQQITAWLKQFPLAATANAQWRCHQSKQQYQALSRRYGTPSVLTEPQDVTALGSRLWQGAAPEEEAGGAGQVDRLHVLFVGTDKQQDYSGIVQALERQADVTIFEQSPGVYGQLWPRTPGEAESARVHNGRRLLYYLESAGERRIDAVIGQMWGLSMDWRALAKIRELGIPVVNIAMDDRHAFTGWTLADSTRGGTQGLIPYLSLACTAAPECVQWYAAEGGTAIFWPEASDPYVFAPLNIPKAYDVCFVGANYGIRAQMVQMLEKSGVAVRTYGSGWANGRISVEEMPRLFAASKIVLGCGTIGYCEDFFALKMRDFDATMSGSLYVTHANPDLAALFCEGAEIVTFKQLPQLVELVRHYLQADEERERIAGAGAQRALREHSWDARFALMLRRLDASQASASAWPLRGNNG